MNIDINPKQIRRLLKGVLRGFRQYSAFIFIIVVLTIYGFIILKINKYSQAEPSDTAVADQQKTIKRLKIDENAIDKMKQLEDQNVGVQSLFETARDNPFQD